MASIDDLKVLSAYCAQGFKLFPLLREEKKPIFKGWREEATDNFKTVKNWYQLYKNCNWGIDLAKSGLVAVDVDRKHGGLEYWEALINKNAPVDTLSASSGGGGKHFVFLADPLVKYRGKIIDGIDVKFNGYIVLFPSVHPDSGKTYRWDNWKTHHYRILTAPDWLKDLITRKPGKLDQGITKRKAVMGLGYLEKLINQLRTYDLGYEDWLNVGMALHAADPGADGLELFLHLTRGESFQDGDEEKARDKWEGFSSDGGITPLSIGHILRQKGGVVPSPFIEDDKQAFRQLKLDKINEMREITAKESEAKGEVFTLDPEDGERLVSWEKNRIVEFFNEKGTAFLGHGEQQAPIIQYKDIDRGLLHVTSMGTKGFFDANADKFYAYTKITATDVKRVLEPAAKCWFESSRKQKFDALVFRPQKDERKKQLNLFTGIPCEPNLGDCDDLIDLLHASVCNSNDAQFHWLMDWLAHIVQFPDVKGTTVPVMVGLQGTGKGLLFDHLMSGILKDLFVTTKTSQELTQRFNHHLGNKLLTFIDEATWRGNKTEDGILKNMIGSAVISIEEKFGLRYTADNYSRYAVASNNPEAVAIERDNRRYVPMETGAKFANKPEVFHPFFEQIRSGDLVARFYNFLSLRDISKFNPYKVLNDNTSGRQAKLATEGIVAHFWENAFFETPKRIFCDPRHLSHSAAYNEFINFAKQVSTYERSLTPGYFWAKTQRLIPKMPASQVSWVNGGSARVRSLGPSEACLSFCEGMSIDPPPDFKASAFIDWDNCDGAEEF